MAKKFYVSIHAIIRAEGKALALHKNIFSDGTPCDLWTLPGGKINENEEPMDCLFREIKEELNVDLQGTPRFVGVYIDINGFSDGTGLIILNYLLDIPKLFTPHLDTEHSHFVWLAWEDFLDLKFHNKKVAMKDILNEI